LVDEIGGPPQRVGAAPDDVDGRDALEHQVRQLMSRLAAWVEAQLVQAVDDRRNDLRVLRSELQAALNEQAAGARAESAAVLTVAIRRLSVNQEQLDQRLEDVAGRSAAAVAGAAALSVAAAADAGRLEALEHALDQGIGRLADSVKVELADSADRRRSEMEAVRAELSERLEGVERRAGRASEEVAVLSAAAEAEAARVLAFEEQLRAAVARLSDSVDARVGESLATGRAGVAADIVALTSTLEDQAARAGAFEERVRTAIVRLTDSVDGRLVEAGEARQAEVDRLQAVLDERLAIVAGQIAGQIAGQVAAGVAGVAASVEAESQRVNAFEEQVRSVISRLTDSVESLAAVSTTRPGEAEALRVGHEAALEERLRAQLPAALTVRLAAQVGELVDGRLNEIVERRRTEFDSLRVELQGALTEQLGEARSQIAAAVAGANKRFSAGLEQLSERMDALVQQVAGSGERVETVVGSVSSDGDRLEALELHTRRTDERLGQLVDAKLASMLTDDPEARTAALRAEIEGAAAAHLGELRAEIAAAAAATERKLVAAQEALEERMAGPAAQAEAAAAGHDAVAASVVADRGRVERLETRGRQSEERLVKTIEARLAEATAAGASEIAALSAELVEVRSQVIDAAAAQARKSGRAQDQLKRSLDDVAARVDDLGAAMAAASSAEKGALAPLRSDVRQLQAQVEELLKAQGDIRSPRRAATPPPGRSAKPASRTPKNGR